MHIIIADVFLSLDEILTVSDVKRYPEALPAFYLDYHSGKRISFFYHDRIKESVEFNKDVFYIKSETAFNLIRGEIIQTLTNAAESNQTGKTIPA